MTRRWSVQEAKANFSELLREAEKEPQIITRHGKVVGVVNGPERAAQAKPKPTVLELLRGDFQFSPEARAEAQDMPGDWLNRAELTLRPAPFSELEEEEAAS